MTCLMYCVKIEFVYWKRSKVRISWQGGSTIIRSSRPEVFCKKFVLRNLAKFTGKHLRQSLFFDKVAGLRPATLLKNRPWHRHFPVYFAKFLRTPFFIEHLWWLFLLIISNWFALLKYFFNIKWLTVIYNFRKILWIIKTSEESTRKMRFFFLKFTKSPDERIFFSSKKYLSKSYLNFPMNINSICIFHIIVYFLCFKKKPPGARRDKETFKKMRRHYCIIDRSKRHPKK